jgi:hypothetical protein
MLKDKLNKNNFQFGALSMLTPWTVAQIAQSFRRP